MERLSVDSESARTLRTRLYSSWKKSDALQYKSKIARPVLAQIENKDVYLRMMEICSNYEPEVRLGQDFMEPKTPLFDRQDVMIYRMLSHYRDGFREAGFDQILIESNNGEESTPKDVLAFVGLLNGQYDSIRGKIEDSRASWTDRVRKEQGKDEADKLFDTYEALEGLLRELASIASR